MKTIVTHDGHFHSDEVLACATLSLIYPEVEVIRTRDPDQIKYYSDQGALVVDVGGVYDPSKGHFDHHQSGFEEYYNSKAERLGIPLSSCGLVYQHYRSRLLVPYLGNHHYMPSIEEIYQLQEQIYFTCYSEFDAGDNGIEIKSYINDNQICLGSHLINLISSFNGDSNDHSKQLSNFKEAMSILRKYLDHKIDQIVSRKAKFDLVKSKIQPKWEECSIIVFIEDIKSYVDSGTLRAVLKDLDINRKLLYIIVRDQETFRLYTLSDSGRFSLRAPLVSEKDAREKVGKELSFIHPNHFTGRCQSLHSALVVANLSLEHHRRKKSPPESETVIIMDPSTSMIRESLKLDGNSSMNSRISGEKSKIIINLLRR